MQQALGEARSNGRGVTGLRRVLRSLEMGEVQSLLIGEDLQAHAVECSACGHMDAHLVSYCPACGHATQEIVDVGEAILAWVVRRDIETFYVKGDAEFDQVGNIAALLRFRSDKVQPIRPVTSADLARTGTESGVWAVAGDTRAELARDQCRTASRAVPFRCPLSERFLPASAMNDPQP